RVDDGEVLGAGADAGFRIGPELTVAGSLYAYRHRDGTGANAVDWTQLRGALRLLWAVGRDPGLRGVEGVRWWSAGDGTGRRARRRVARSEGRRAGRVGRSWTTRLRTSLKTA